MENPYEGAPLGGQVEVTENRVNICVEDFFEFISIQHSCSSINIWFAVSTVHNARFAGEDPGQ